MAIFNLNDPQPGQPDKVEPSLGQPAPGQPAAAAKRVAAWRSAFKCLFAIAVLVGALVGWHFYLDQSKGLAPESIAALFTETFSLRWPQPPAAVVPKAPTSQSKLNGKLPQISPVFVDDANNLDTFYAALWSLERPGPDQSATGQPKPGQPKPGQPEQGAAAQAPAEAGDVVTILHYGDSPTTADMITGDVRARLQERFGDAGRGYTLIAKPWAWYGHRGVEMSDHGWKIRTSIGLMREGIYGLGGAGFEGEPGAWSKFRLTDSPQSSVEVEYLAKPGGGAFAVDADDAANP